jgi:hypothetical protein
MYQVQSAVACIVFNRPELSAAMLARVAAVRPRMLLVVADGARPERIGEAEQCAAVRKQFEQIDWPCEVITNYAEQNLGCRMRLSSGIDWIFEQVEEAIILEDDCIADEDFFRYCDELLHRYRYEPKVMHIGGTSFQFGRRYGSTSYTFSRYPHIWGWATWRRAWQHYDLSMQLWSETPNKSLFLEQFEDPAERSFWETVWNASSRGELDTWDYQWCFACMAQQGLNITPQVNLVSNIGFGKHSTHTKLLSPFSNIPRSKLAFPLEHPRLLETNRLADAYVARLQFSERRSIRRMTLLGDALIRRLVNRAQAIVKE